MTRQPRTFLPGYPHHITQRGNRKQSVFFNDGDYSVYISLMCECRRKGIEFLAYCLMPNHVHLIVAPENETVLQRAIGDAHRRYTRHINFREGWRGHLWQGRFSSFVLDTNYLLSAVRYIELNPVRAGLVKLPEQWQWSSANAHISGNDDELVKAAPMRELVREDWRKYLSSPFNEDEAETIRKHERTGLPLGSDEFVTRISDK